tara:strand:- start:6817 stop:7464 length:648 start_codon:yes stop_codon:yes gene_type:complete
MNKINGKFAPIVDPEIVLRGFGLQALKAKYYNTKINEEEQDENTPDPPVTSYLGTPVFAQLLFIPGKYKDVKGEEVVYGEIFKNDDNEENFVINTVLIDVSQQKQIIKTNIQGVSGTVKEYISKGDYQVTIRGALVSESSVRYPEEEVTQLTEYLEAETSIGVASRFLDDIFNIQNIVVESFSFPQVEGTQNVQLFEVSAVSDDPIELTVLNAKG